MFYVYVCSPDEGLFMARTTDPARPWELFHDADIAQWEDPCPFWDEDGNTYLAHSKLAGGPAVIHKMSADGTKLLDNGVIVYQNKVDEFTNASKNVVIPDWLKCSFFSITEIQKYLSKQIVGDIVKME